MQVKTITASNVETLRVDAEAAHRDYSVVAIEYQKAEEALAVAARVRSNLTQTLNANYALLDNLREAAIKAAIAGQQGFKTAAVLVSACATETALLSDALQRFHRWDFQDFQRALLVAQVEMLYKQHLSEKARLAHHLATIHLSLGQTVTMNGALQDIELGGVVRGMENLIFAIGRDLDGARQAINTHDEETFKLRNEVRDSK